MKSLEGRYLVDAIAPTRNFLIRTLFAVLRLICDHSCLRYRSLLKLWKCLLYTDQWGVSYNARTQQRLLALLEKNIRNIISPNVLWPNTSTSLLFIRIANIVISSEIFSLFRNLKRRCLSMSHAPFSFHHKELVFPHQMF